MWMGGREYDTIRIHPFIHTLRTLQMLKSSSQPRCWQAHLWVPVMS